MPNPPLRAIGSISAGGRRIPRSSSAAIFLVAAIVGLMLVAYLSNLPQGAPSETEADLTLIFPRY